MGENPIICLIISLNGIFRPKYFVTQNKKIVDANTGRLIDDSTIKEIDLENKKSNKYVWDCCYTLNF